MEYPHGHWFLTICPNCWTRQPKTTLLRSWTPKSRAIYLTLAKMVTSETTTRTALMSQEPGVILQRQKRPPDYQDRNNNSISGPGFNTRHPPRIRTVPRYGFLFLFFFFFSFADNLDRPLFLFTQRHITPSTLADSSRALIYQLSLATATLRLQCIPWGFYPGHLPWRPVPFLRSSVLWASSDRYRSICDWK